MDIPNACCSLYPLGAARDREGRSAHGPEVVSRPAGRPLHVHHGHAH